MTEYKSTEIADMLAQVRPDRYEAGDIGWAQPVIDIVADNLDGRDARFRTAETVVQSIEKSATRRTNRLLREITKTGVFPLDWIDSKSWPLTVGNGRVVLSALTSADLRQFADEEEERADKDHKARLDAVKGARILADIIDTHGCRTAGHAWDVQGHA